ncbi:hypothetical protein EPUS_02125 [Endocarpon pusillum Z07020]|uniref:Tetratricopeptide repeat protein 36 n=1 Tax=Endocarpon pusillum (strain Z07020 / HMAS-L-300199) TaxID=1263415 RepID=U1GJB8_ENDPU|nr:uncharacterized protein EPUS_02125 [Endocarpon pusillum Z07020]ERF72238.1 hypothetical protein EPUS_02125 [Endocarpon pusillum Z07020]
MATGTIIQPQTTSLTSNDTAVLSALFDPESSPSSSISISNVAPTLPHIPNAILPDLQQREISAIQSLNTESPSQPSIESSISDLSVLINEYPKYAPAYLNRAQATRLLIGEETDLFHPRNNDLISRALSDLEKAISLASPSFPPDPLSDLQASLLSKAHTHRGYLLLKASQAVRQAGLSLPTDLAGLSGEELEEMASKDFSLGGKYGNKIAREMSVKTNPYAKICGAIVKEAMRKEREDYARGYQ